MTATKKTSSGRHPDLTTALLAAQAGMPKAKKNQTANYGKYSDLDSVREACIPQLTEHGIVVSQSTLYDSVGRFVLRTELVHDSTGETRASEWPLPTEGKSQALGSALTYARRYTLACLAGVSLDDDDDGQLAQEAKPIRQAAPVSKTEAPSKQNDFAEGQRIKEAMWKETTVGGVQKVFTANQKIIDAMQDKSRNQITARRDERISEIEAIIKEAA